MRGERDAHKKPPIKCPYAISVQIYKCAMKSKEGKADTSHDCWAPSGSGGGQKCGGKGKNKDEL